MNKRIFAMLLAALLLASASLTACGDSKTTETTGTADTTTTESVEETEPEETLDITVQDYGGHTVNIAMTGNWSYDDFTAEELTGEPSTMPSTTPIRLYRIC